MLGLKSTILNQSGISQLALFRRQYLQRHDVNLLTFPERELLRQYRVQQWIWMFVEYAQTHFANPAYDRLFLKTLQSRIEEAVHDAREPDVVNDFAELYVQLGLASQTRNSGIEYSWVYYVPPWQELDPSRPEQGISVLENRSILSAAGSTGHRTWEACLHFCGLYLADCSVVKGKSVLELGSGTGLLSLIAAKQGASQVMATDGDAHAVLRIKEAAERNDLSITCRHYQWGDDMADLSGDFDAVFAADVTYDRHSIPHLVETLQQLVMRNQKTAIWVCATMRNMDTLTYFLNTCNEHTLRVNVVHERPETRQTGFFHLNTPPVVTMFISYRPRSLMQTMDVTALDDLQAIVRG